PKPFETWVERKASWEFRITVPDNVQDFELPPIELVPTVERAGQLQDASGQPLGAMRVSAVVANRVYDNATSDADGAFELHLPADLTVEQYTVHDDHGARMVANVVGDSPLVLQVGR